jgi:FlaA1/EpsC-like NDP-sugar epimerase
MIDNIYNQCLKLTDISNERILIFGGSGSLGRTTINRWINKNIICNVSRDEEKQWSLNNLVNNHKNLSQIIGDISIEKDVINSILIFKPTIICIFACLKHIELCEKNPEKSILNNCNGIININNTLLKYDTSVKTVLFVSTDKACLPITSYGCSKAISEFYLQGIVSEKTKWVGVRYGNVLNSSGSIIPYLKNNSGTAEPYKLTHPDMTRFIMTLDQSVTLIEYALEFGKHNEIIIPFIYSMRIIDLFNIFAEKYKKNYIISGLRCKEKIHEDLLSPFESKNSYINNGYYHITNKIISDSDLKPFNSSDNIISIEVLKEYLIQNNIY